MKTVFLILYLWHASGGHATYSGGTGGPAIVVTQMPSLAACEVVGGAAKVLADQTAPESPSAGNAEYPWSKWAFTVRPASYRCVEVAK